jgi:hypothetical protein
MTMVWEVAAGILVMVREHDVKEKGAAKKLRMKNQSTLTLLTINWRHGAEGQASFRPGRFVWCFYIN